MTLEEAAIENGWARLNGQGGIVWRADEVHPGEVWDAAVAAERERCAKLCDAQFWIVTRARGGDAAVAAGECAASIRGA